MILYHFIYDLDVWTNLPIDVDTFFWFWEGKISALLFIFLSGVSSGLSKRPAKNGIKVLLWGLVVTIVTRIVLPDEYVRFGILHFLGTMMIIYPLLKRLPSVVLLLFACLALGFGFFVPGQVVHTALLLPFGLTYPGFNTMDYYPLFPYSGVTLLGILFYRYRLAKPNNEEKHPLNTLSERSNLLSHPVFQTISSHSLGIYLVHQPILLLIIFSLNMVLR
jgi:uncharacterized membrane protein